MHNSHGIFSLPGYAFMTLDMRYMLGQNYTYRPELGDELWDGVINVQPKVPDGEVSEQSIHCIAPWTKLLQLGF